MFEFGRELRRWFGGDSVPGGFQDGLTGGDRALLELLELDLLRAEAKAADVAAGRISAKDRPQRQLEAARVWREIARRTGDAAALRKAAAQAEQAAAGVGRESRPRRWAAARCEQALAAMTGATLFGDDGLDAAADFALIEAQKTAGASLPALHRPGRPRRRSRRAGADRAAATVRPRCAPPAASTPRSAPWTAMARRGAVGGQAARGRRADRPRRTAVGLRDAAEGPAFAAHGAGRPHPRRRAP